MALHCISPSATCLSASHAHRRSKTWGRSCLGAPSATHEPGRSPNPWRKPSSLRAPTTRRTPPPPWPMGAADRQQVAGARMVPHGSMHKVTMSLLEYPDVDGEVAAGDGGVTRSRPRVNAGKMIDDSIFSRLIGPS
ncbi:hypothetical protein SETIT_1G055800v2 [Setaria italica]|uniref:Uncharacterized protein n=2 Tax=Setaria TaxID=4554 RepID=A0A368PI57_SETIT|nr:hypothetical protein SETIT_1G055800v2 [Setaria italica]TKW37554.1 hypothetical protein SEVIR_1G055200v2 [Setaria viridis]